MLYANEHPPPHFHAKYAEHQAVIDIETLTISEGFLPMAKRRAVLAWAMPRQRQLLEAFEQTRKHEDVEPIL